jgi:pimeloyl-ACP methyl ester carboxylesterase
MQTVTSQDGTNIAYERQGQGPAIILVEGAMGVRSSGMGLAKLLATDFTVYCYDRRGRGDSTDTKPYSVKKEVEDIAALIEETEGSAYLYGISSGGALALEAAIQLGIKVRKLAVYEVPYDSSDAGINAWREYRTKLTELLTADRPGEAVALFMKFVGVPDEMVEGMRHAPSWKAMELVAPTLACDAAVLGQDHTVPTDRATRVTAETLVMGGSASYEFMPFMRATAETLTNAIPNAQHRILEGQRHDVDAKVLAPVLAEFFKR